MVFNTDELKNLVDTMYFVKNQQIKDNHREKLCFTLWSVQCMNLVEWKLGCF